jgi:serine/threonine protein kinase
VINQNLGSYRITHLLGQGGMGAVYAAEHTLIGKRAAVKVLLPELSRDPEMVQRFFNEARSAALIRHPGWSRSSISATSRTARRTWSWSFSTGKASHPG